MTNLPIPSTNVEDNLPRWNLGDFYSSLNDPQIQQDLNQAEGAVKKFTAAYQQKFGQKKVGEPGQERQSCWTGHDLYKAIQEYESLDEILSKLMTFGYLSFATNVNNPPVLQFFQMIQERSTTISSHLIFFTLDLNGIEEEELAKAYEENPQLNRYKSWIDNIRLFRQHLLSADLEKLLHEKTVTGQSAWARLFEETLAGIKFSIKGEEKTLATVLNMMGDKEASVRKEGAQSLSEGLTRHISILALVMNTLVKDKEIEDSWRHYSHPAASRNLSNQVEDEVVEALVKTVKANYGRLSHRYYRLKAKWLGLEKLDYWDRNAPLPDGDDSLISWSEAQDIVLNAYHTFNPEMAKIGRRFFEEGWIDAPSQAGKESGAFSHPAIPGVHPYILLNYHGKRRDVMTLAHELGHGIHQVLAANQGHLLSNTPLTIAETASVFGEMLTFKSLLAKASDSVSRRSLLISKVDDMINTVVRQIAFYEFEQAVHQRRRTGELSAEDMGDIWIETQKEALGEAVKLDPLVRPYWGYVSHFIHTPFYVYAYAFGDCLVNSLYAVYESGHPDFASLYLELLKAGGTKRYPELLRPFGLDAKNPLFWQKGLDVIASFIDELESIN